MGSGAVSKLNFLKEFHLMNNMLWIYSSHEISSSTLHLASRLMIALQHCCPQIAKLYPWCQQLLHQTIDVDNDIVAPLMSTKMPLIPLMSTNVSLIPLMSTKRSLIPLISTEVSLISLMSTNVSLIQLMSTNVSLIPLMSTNVSLIPLMSTNVSLIP